MRIAQVSPLHESVPPQYYGGTERVVSYLTEGLVARGHDVTLFASGDSSTTARLVRAGPRALRLNGGGQDAIAHHLVMLEEVVRQSTQFDVVHFHCDYLAFPFARRMRTPTLSTMHGRLDLDELELVYREYGEVPLVSISDAQRTPRPTANWMATVYHGVPMELYGFQPEPGTYLAFIGRISPEKGVDRAIEVARLSGVPLRIAAKVDPKDRDYYEAVIRPLIDGSLVQYVGELSEHEKSPFLGGALALLFLIDWPEPFGLAMIESMACGTPVVAVPRGSVPEILDHGTTGLLVPSVEGAVEALELVSSLDRRLCRQAFEERFSVERMVRDYEAVYRETARDVLRRRVSVA